MKFASSAISLLFVSLFSLAVNPGKDGRESRPQLPDDFRWCVSTSAYQIEGGLKNSDWWHWEQTPGRVTNNDSSGLASDHWNRVEEDTKLLVDLKVTDYRMSIDWSRLEPRPGEWDQSAIKQYRKEIQLIKKNGIRPIITLHHFTFPQWVREKGAWEWSGLNEAFKKYTEVVFTQIGPDVDTWITINEPNVHLLMGYVVGKWPPSEKRSPRDTISIIRSMMKLHAQTYHQLKNLAEKQGLKIDVGLAFALSAVDSAQEWNFITKIIANIGERIWNWLFADAIQTGRFKIGLWPYVYVNEEIEGLKGTQDFFGVNYYFSHLIKLTFKGVEVIPRPNAKRSDMNWEIHPEGLYKNLKTITGRYPGLPILITENGIADSKDSLRPQFLLDHVNAMVRAINEGAPVIGYCHWSFIDNFEWADGFEPRFGLIEVDYKTQKRTPRPSAELFRNLSPLNRAKK